MNLNQLKYLIALDLYPSLNAAAEHIPITPQSLGAAIKALEKELDVTLLERSPHGSLFTPQGQELVRIVKPFVSALDQFVLNARAVAGEVKIAASYDSFYGYLPYILQDLYQIAPDLKIYVKHMITADVLSAVQNATADLGIIFQTFYEGLPLLPIPASLTTFPLIDYQLVCQATSKYPCTRHKTTTFQELVPYPLIVPVMFNDLSASLYSLIEHFTHRDNITLEYSVPVYRAMIRSGRGIGFSIKHPYEEQISTHIPDLPSVILTEDVKIQLCCLYRANPDSHSAPTQYFLNYLHNTIQI